MSTSALNKLLEYILSLSLSDTNKEWLANKIIESKSEEKGEDMHIFDCFDGTWGGDRDSHEIADELHDGRVNTRVVETW